MKVAAAVAIFLIYFVPVQAQDEKYRDWPGWQKGFLKSPEPAFSSSLCPGGQVIRVDVGIDANGKVSYAKAKKTNSSLQGVAKRQFAKLREMAEDVARRLEFRPQKRGANVVDVRTVVPVVCSTGAP